ncbi:trans-aconitate methyltransferase [Saccharothrix sp. NRRL B-16348]|uniref:class I SAM-dependent methyltransferase n=1 Tax=Saccharothrix sp. NRRL B-16348 TaxID=1415542 RepID=UPI0006AFC78B|nr:class I SAM-dependent methyltransferase [Saccharothrix sp. NRRL B-16348]KOX34408.1 trans-aconitate methyltransferase [Saccharothrix sp. NRRL B-16348]
MSTFAPEWLSLREKADAEARALDLVDRLQEINLNRTPLVVRDLGCGTGSLGRWLAGRLGGPQRWVLHDRDPRLLSIAAATMSGVTIETHEGDLTGLTGADIAGTSLVTGSALLDLLTAEEVDGLAGACVDAGCPALLTLSVAGRVEFDPAESLDAEFEAAFNAHQRRVVGGRRLLGPDAVAVAVEAFERRGAEVTTSPSPWRLGPEQAALAGEWLRGWVAAAVEQEPDLGVEAPAYLRRKLDNGPRVVVHHTDLLAVPR